MIISHNIRISYEKEDIHWQVKAEKHFIETITKEVGNVMKPCRECRHTISEQALSCPHCGVPCPAQEKWNGWGFEYKSEATFFGLPWLHISFKYRPNRMPVPAKGIFAIGQFACGVFTLSQFGVGLVSISQFTIAGFALAQFAAAYSLIAQFGLYIHEGHGQIVVHVTKYFQ